MTFKEALAISIKKWEIIVNQNDGKELTIQQANNLEVINLHGWCALCEYFKYEKPQNNGGINCEICPMFTDGKSCFYDDHLYMQWDEKHKNAAIDILNILKNADLNKIYES